MAIIGLYGSHSALVVERPGNGIVYDISKTTESYRVKTGMVRETGVEWIKNDVKNSMKRIGNEFDELLKTEQISEHLLVPFAKPQVKVPVSVGLSFDFDEGIPLYKYDHIPKDSAMIEIKKKEFERHYRSAEKEDCPTTDVRVFIGIASRASVQSRAKRDAIRSAWLKDIKDKHPEIRAMFLVSQPKPSSRETMIDIANDLMQEASKYNDIAILPGLEAYRELPSKTISMIRYGLSSDCQYTHIVKTDDDVYLRPTTLLRIINKGEYHAEMDIQGSSEILDNKFRIKHKTEVPWKHGMYLGKVDRNVTNSFPGFVPVRNQLNKWYLSEKNFPDEISPSGTRWISGWGYIMSRDIASIVLDKSLANAKASPEQRPPWWGRLPWEDVVVAALLKNHTTLHLHNGFKAAWDECDKDTVLRHLDNQAPALTAGLAEQDRSGLWSVKSVECSAGNFTAGDYFTWRAWRNSLPDSLLKGYM